MSINYARDSQRRKCYDAENAVFGIRGGAENPEADPLWLIEARTLLPELSDILRYTKWLLRLKRVKRIVVPKDPNAATGCGSSPWIPAASARLKDIDKKIVVTDKRGGGASAMWWKNEMEFSKRCRRKCDVIHELAHILAPAEVHHHWQFTFIYLLLVRYALGKEAERALRLSFKGRKVKYLPPRKRRELSEAERSALRDRLKIARSLRKVKQPSD